MSGTQLDCNDSHEFYGKTAYLNGELFYFVYQGKQSEGYENKRPVAYFKDHKEAVQFVFELPKLKQKLQTANTQLEQKVKELEANIKDAFDYMRSCGEMLPDNDSKILAIICKKASEKYEALETANAVLEAKLKKAKTEILEKVLREVGIDHPNSIGDARRLFDAELAAITAETLEK